MTDLKKLAMYCREYVGLISGYSRLGQSKRVKLPLEVLDASPIFINEPGFNYENITLPLNLDIDLTILDDVFEEEKEDSNHKEEVDKIIERQKYARDLDEIYRKFETSSYTKQVHLKFGRVTFKGLPLVEAADSDDQSKTGLQLKEEEQYLFSVPISIIFYDSGGQRRYTLSVDDSKVSTNADFLGNYLEKAQRDEIFKFISRSEIDGLADIPLDSGYVDELWSKIKYLLSQSGALNISNTPDLENTLVILLPRVNYFLVQDLLGIIDKAEEEDLLNTSLGAWVEDSDMDIIREIDDSGNNELFFPFPYDNSQLQVLGLLENKAAVVEGPPGTGKSQTIANILCHMAATEKKVLFVSQKDQAIRGVKDKLKSLDIDFLFGYIPDRFSRLHNEDDEKDSAANLLKGISQSEIKEEEDINTKEPLSDIHSRKFVFDNEVDKERDYYSKYIKYQQLNKYEFGRITNKITLHWYQGILQQTNDLKELQSELSRLETEKESLKDRRMHTENKIVINQNKFSELSSEFFKSTAYSWIDKESVLLRSLSYKEVDEIIDDVLDCFETSAKDRDTNLLSRNLRNIRLSKAINKEASSLPKEIYETLKDAIFSEGSKSERYMRLKKISEYFNEKKDLEVENKILNQELEKLDEKDKSVYERIKLIQVKIKKINASLQQDGLDEHSMNRLNLLFDEEGQIIFDLIAERSSLNMFLEEFELLRPNKVNEIIKEEKKRYNRLISKYLQNRRIQRISKLNRDRNFRSTRESVARMLKKTKRAYKTFDNLKSNPFNFEVMSDIVPIWMMSLDDASRILPLVANMFDYVIIDEASQCNISYVLPVMYRARHTVLFGDTLQMRDTTTAFKSNEKLKAIADKYEIPDDLQIKAVEDSVKSVMEIAELSGFQTRYLKYHYRSPRELIGFSNQNFYKPIGRNLEVINDDVHVTDEGRVLTNYVITPNLNDETSEKTNISEAHFIRDKLLPELLNNPKTKDRSIAILTFFNEQAELLRKVIPDKNIKVSVIEGIQGDEKDIVIYSFVIKSPEEKKRYIPLTGESGEIRKGVNEGRVNVAFSRARLQVYTVTSLPIELWPEGIWIKKYLEYVDKTGLVTRTMKSDQEFDSKFEEDVYDYLVSTFEPDIYSIKTQVKSCGFKIDLVISNIKNNRKIAIECDGPTHFESGDGQVYVKNDYERQYVLETAGWNFYRIPFSSWYEDMGDEKRDLKNFIVEYLNTRISPNEPYKVDYKNKINESIKEDFRVQTPILKNSDSKSNEKITEDYILNKEKQKDFIVNEKSQNKEPIRIENKKKINTDFTSFTEIELGSARYMVLSQRKNGDYWVNERIDTKKFSGFTKKGFGVPKALISDYVEALNYACRDKTYEKIFVVNEELCLIIKVIDDKKVDIRYYKTTENYAGYTKKGLRISKEHAKELADVLSNLT